MSSAKKTGAIKPKSPEIQRAKNAFEALRAERGQLSRIAEELGLTAQAVHQWPIVPLKYLMEVSRVTGVSPRKLRPDFQALLRDVAGE